MKGNLPSKISFIKHNSPCFKQGLYAKKHLSSIWIFAVITCFAFITPSSYAQSLSEDFESGIPATWDKIHNSSANIDWEAVSGEGYQGSQAAKIAVSSDNVGAGNTGEYFLVTPQITIPENGVIRFYTKLGTGQNDNTEYQLRLSTANQPDINGFDIVLKTWTAAELNTDATSYEQKSIEIPSGISAGLNVYLAFVAVNPQTGSTSSGADWFIDDVEVIQGCEPVDIEDISIDNITPVGADISWTHPSTSTFEVAVVPVGDPAPISGVSVTTTAYTFTGLQAGTSYDAYIKSECSNGSGSSFVGPVTFTTAIMGTSCDFPIVIPDVFTQGDYLLQDNLSNYSNPNISYTTQGSGCLDPNINYLNGDKIFFKYTASADGLITLSQETAGFDPSNPLGNCYNSNTSILIYDSCSDVGNACLAATKTDYNHLTGQITNFVVTAGETYIFVMSSDLNPGSGICFDFTITGAQCAPPSDFSYDDLSQNSVVMSWGNPGGFADTWEYIALPAGTGPPTAAGTSTLTSTNNIVTGLDAGTAYDFYVRAICDGTPGAWSSAYSFTTQCSIFSTPYEELFTGATESAPADCWYTIDANEDGYGWTYLTDNATLPFFNPTSFDDYFVSPTIDLSGGQKRLRFTYSVLGGDVPVEILASSTGVGADNFTISIDPQTTYTETGWGVEVEKIIVLPTSLTGNLNFAFHVASSSAIQATRINIVDFIVENMPACSDPLEPAVSDITQTSAKFNWTPGFEETQWEVIIQDHDAPAPTETSTGTVVSDNPYTAEDLEPGHRYAFYVRAYCNDQDQSQWVGPVNFNTLCPIYEAPFYESFNDEDPDTQKFCWEIIDNNNDGFTFSSTAEDIKFLTPMFGGIQGFDDYVVSPAINVQGTKVLSFDYRTTGMFGAPGTFDIQVLMSTTDTDPESFEEIEPMFTIGNPNFETKYVPIEANGPVYIAFRIPPESLGASGTLTIDEVHINDGPGCIEPQHLTVESVLDGEATVSWDPGLVETEWDVVMQPAGTGLPVQNPETVTETTYTGTNLEPGTEYEVYVRARCGADDTSDWIGPVTFMTPCEAFTSPFQETFNYDSLSEDCWLIVDNNGDGETWNTSIGVFPYQGDQSAGMFTGQNGANDDWLISPQINITANQRLRFYYRAGSQYYIEDLQVWVSITGRNPEDFTAKLFDSNDYPDPYINSEEYLEKIINFPDTISGPIYVAFRVPQVQSDMMTRGQSLYIDNVNIEDVPDCPAPSNLSTSSISDTSVELTWEANGDEDSWEVVVLPEGSEPPAADVSGDNVYEATTNPFTVDGLDPSTAYDFYVRSNCSENGAWEGPLNVTTLCDLNNLCQFTFVLYSTFGYGAEGLDITQNNQVVQTLPFNGNEDGEEFTVLLCSGIQFSAYFNTIGTVASQYEQFWFEIKDFEGNVVYTSPDEGMQPKSTVYTGVSHCGEESCPMPTDLTVSESGEFSWTPGSAETQWEVAVQPVGNGTLPESGHIVDSPNYTPSAEDFVDPYAATYEYFVRAVCSDSDQSYWAGPYVFVRNDSEANSISLPINEGEDCEIAETAVSFSNAYSSDYSVDDQKDVWFDFVATSKVHVFEVNGFEGNFYISIGTEPYPDIQMTLYKVLDNGDLEEMVSSENNVIVASYDSELVVGDSYKIQLSLDNPDTNTRLFQLCTTSPDPCQMDAVNYGFERPALHYVHAINSIITQYVVPGWRQDFIGSGKDEIYLWNDIIAMGFAPYEGAQCVQLISDQPGNPAVGTPPGYEYDPNDPHGLYKDFNSSEITAFDYSFAYQARNPDDVTIQLFAGPPGGPYTLVTEKNAPVGEWATTSGTYQVPEGQTVTRFMFTQKYYGLGMLLDAANFTANNNILTADQAIGCAQDSILVEANGTGQWIASESNPGQVSIATPDSSTTSITGFVQPGTYTFTWKTRYCEDVVSFEYNGVGETPQVNSPVEYCLNETATALSAPELDGYTLMWFTNPEESGMTTAPTPNTSVAGSTTYYVAYVNADGCQGPLAEIVVTVNDLSVPILDFSYDNTCLNAQSNPTPVLTTDFTEGGTFTSDDLIVDPITGEVDLTNATAGTYQVTYTLEADYSNCMAEGTYTTEFEIYPTIVPDTDFSYSSLEYCITSVSELPIIGQDFTATGTFTAEDGLAIDPITGEINFEESTPGQYTIEYTVEADSAICQEAATSSFSITVYGDLNLTISQDCSQGELILTAESNDAGLGDIQYIWKNEAGQVLDEHSNVLNVNAYLMQHQSQKLPLTFTVSVAYGDCMSTAAYQVVSNPCGFIPQGISPNQDGVNDNLDLRYMDVRSLKVYNRYGTKVYHKSNGYTDEWHGQSSNGDALTTGTYYYILEKQDGSVVKGWIYINQAVN